MCVEYGTRLLSFNPGSVTLGWLLNSPYLSFLICKMRITVILLKTVAEIKEPFKYFFY